MRRIEIRLANETIAALDEQGHPLETVKKEVKAYGKGSVIHLPQKWQGEKVIVIRIPLDFTKE